MADEDALERLLLFTPMRSKARSVFAVMALTAAVAGPSLAAGGGADAKAATTGVRIFVRAQLTGAPRTLCVGDTVRWRVDVRKTVSAGSLSTDAAVIGVGISASATSGTVSPTSRVTSMSGSPIGATYFSFKADRVGVAIITFTSRVNQLQFLGMPVLGFDVRTTKTVNVEDCKYRLTVTSLWQVAGEAQITVMAKIEIAGLVDAGNGRYTGSAAVQWEVIVGQVGDCEGTLPPESTAEVVGEVPQDDDELVSLNPPMTLTVTYATAMVSLNVDCKGAGGSMNVALTPETLSGVALAAGETKTTPQVLGGPGNDRGNATLILRRVGGR